MQHSGDAWDQYNDSFATWYMYAAIGLATARVYLTHRPDLGPEERKMLLG